MGNELIWQAPAIAASCIAVVTVFVRLGRRDKTLENHSQTLEELRTRKTMDPEACKAIQQACAKQQQEFSRQIMTSLADLKAVVEKNRDELKEDVDKDRAMVHSELMKITKSIGRIEGAIGRLRIDDTGNVL